MKTLVLIVSLAAVACALPADKPDIEKEWSDFKTKHGKTYKTSEQETLHKNNFAMNLIRVRNHNNDPARNYEVAINKFSDLTTAEVTRMLMGNGEAVQRSLPVLSNMMSPVMSLAPSMDWRKKGCVGEVKDQGYTNFGWAFATTGAYESEYCLKTGKMEDLSEQSVIDCTPDHESDYVYFGVSDFSVSPSERDSLDTELSYPFTAQKGECKHNATTSVGPLTDFVVRYMWSDDDLLDFITINGPAAVSIDVSDWGFHHYASGIYHNSGCNKTLASVSHHGGLIVGYGSTDNSDFWIVKNSFGPEWGEKGYIRMRRNTSSSCFGDEAGIFMF